MLIVSQNEGNGNCGGAADLLVRRHGFAKVSQQVVGVAQVAVGPTLSGAIAELLHDGQVRPGDDRQQLDTAARQTTRHIDVTEGLSCIYCCLKMEKNECQQLNRNIQIVFILQTKVELGKFVCVQSTF